MRVKGISRFPDDHTFRRLLEQMETPHLHHLIDINRQLLAAKSEVERPREIILDADDTVIILIGEQEGGRRGYNPRYLGRPSHNARVGFVSGSDENLYPGDFRGAAGYQEVLIDCEEALPSKWVLKGVRSDSNFPSRDGFLFMEDRHLQYACKMRKSKRLQKTITYLTEQDMWQPLDEYCDVAEMRISLYEWEKARRFVFIREKFDRRTGQKILDGFRHQVICTNLQIPAVEVWRFYNQRCTVENRISELKDGFAMDQQSQHTLFKNTAYATIKVVVYNLPNWMKAVALPKETRTYRSDTLRRKIFCGKELFKVEGAFRVMKRFALRVGPIRHRKERRVRAHVFLCMLARYVRWHMEKKLAPMLLTDHQVEQAGERRESIVSPARRSTAGERKVRRQKTDHGEPARSFQTLLEDLRTLTKNQVRVEGAEVTFRQYARPTALQEKVFELLDICYRMQTERRTVKPP